MNRCLSILWVTAFLIGFFTAAASAKWSLLEDYQMTDVSCDKGICIPVIQDECDFDYQLYGISYPEDDLKDDMDEARDNGLEMIFYDFSFKHQYIPFPHDTHVFQKPVKGEPFFESDWFTPGFAGWEKLCEELFKSAPCN